MNHSFAYYSAHMQSPISAPNSRRETEIEYIFRVAREKADAEKAERRRVRQAQFKEILARILKFKRTPSLQSLLGQ
ncbi:hypothetical protein GCM10011348_01100 [Marinobacterium nitratireducens]|uniref:Uncharacterized protein n=1 Tax=Marinobacterium nitratireducens TaxID=518897 RepID=A0A917Z5J0_9GAMM|nr:hypothetical protein [Marinobacterium nitratireducens]GGO75695.1 hypothetical protein GCM10011348_01100 [Marinobacterium nitratireducens]